MFTQPCFIRKNTFSLRESLEYLGYKPFMNNRFSLPYLSTHSDGVYFQIDANKENGLECFNDNQFIAIAALRDDKEDMQLFTDGKQWIFWDTKNLGSQILFLQLSLQKEKPHKATVKELIEHFKDKED